MTFTLDYTDLNKTVVVNKISGEESLKRRFLDLGFIPGTPVKCMLISPFKDPKAYFINGNLIALRNNDAKFIEVYYE